MSNPFVEFLRPHKTVPVTPWTAQSRWQLNPSRVAVLFFGLFIFGLGDSLLILSTIGNAPWSVLAQGVSNRLDITMGWSTFAISTAVLLLWIPLREKPGFGTISNIVIIATAIQIGVSLFPQQDDFAIAVIYCLVGIAMVGFGSALYITCGLGPGPRDGLMLGLSKRSIAGRQISIRVARTVVEISVMVAGLFLGGSIGIGTLIFMFGIGPLVQLILPRFEM